MRKRKKRQKKVSKVQERPKSEGNKLLDKYAIFSSHVNEEGTVMCVVAHLTSPLQYAGAPVILAEIVGRTFVQSVYTTVPEFHEFYLGNGFHPAILHPAYKYHLN